jgi:hypothetical protein
MSDSYEIAGVKITPASGGYYDLEHSSLQEPERVRGKEKADQRAEEIGKKEGTAKGNDGDAADATFAAGDTGLIPAQKFPGEDTDIAAARAAAASEGKSEKEVAAIGAPVQAEDSDLVKENKELKSQLQDFMSKFEGFMKAAQPIVQTVTEEGEKQPDGTIPNSVPRSFAGEMSKESKSALKKLGIGVTKIVLEESAEIPPTGLFLGHNGRSYMISPGEEVDVPDFLLGVLDDAVMSAPTVDAKSQKVLGYRNRMRYPYRRVS